MTSFVRFFVTSRPHVDLIPEFSNISRVVIRASDSDIKAYLTSEINKTKRLAMFTTKDPQLKEDIVNTINKKAGGM
jgi:hypothetical protein